MSNKIPHVKKPCKNCPFRTDCLKGWLGAKRMSKILEAGSFVCHKNTKLQCAGHMLMKGMDNDFVRSAYCFDIKLELSGSELVFKSHKDCIEHHE